MGRCRPTTAAAAASVTSKHTICPAKHRRVYPAPPTLSCRFLLYSFLLLSLPPPQRPALASGAPHDASLAQFIPTCQGNTKGRNVVNHGREYGTMPYCTVQGHTVVRAAARRRDWRQCSAGGYGRGEGRGERGEGRGEPITHVCTEVTMCWAGGAVAGGEAKWEPRRRRRNKGRQRRAYAPCKK